MHLFKYYDFSLLVNVYDYIVRPMDDIIRSLNFITLLYTHTIQATMHYTNNLSYY